MSPIPSTPIHPWIAWFPKWPSTPQVWFAKILADFELNDIAVLPPLFCYNS